MSTTETATTEAAPAGNLNAVGMSIALTVKDLSTSLDFYTNGLGFEVQEKHEFEGEVRYIQMSAGNAQLGIGQDDFAKGHDRAKGVGFRIWLNTSQDVYELAERAKTAGIELAEEAQEMPWGGHSFAVVDPDGFNLSIASP
ncbi:MAG: VOC family protein [Gemmatimonadota bacterium]|nr:VOC family protein [Gemmatimonadota bacterium]